MSRPSRFRREVRRDVRAYATLAFVAGLLAGLLAGDAVHQASEGDPSPDPAEATISPPETWAEGRRPLTHLEGWWLQAENDDLRRRLDCLEDLGDGHRLNAALVTCRPPEDEKTPARLGRNGGTRARGASGR